MKIRLIDHVIIRFISVGWLNMLSSMITIYLCLKVLSFSDALSNMLGYGVGLTLSYTLNSRFTFRYKGDWKKSIVRFLLVVIIAYACNLLVVLAVIEYTPVDQYLAHWTGIPVYTVVFFIGSRYFAFREGATIDATVR